MSKEGIETDAKKQRRNYRIAMISDKGGWLQDWRYRRRDRFTSVTRARLRRGPSSQIAIQRYAVTVGNSRMRRRYFSLPTDHRGLERLYILMSEDGKSHRLYPGFVDAEGAMLTTAQASTSPA